MKIKRGSLDLTQYVLGYKRMSDVSGNFLLCNAPSEQIDIKLDNSEHQLEQSEGAFYVYDDTDVLKGTYYLYEAPAKYYDEVSLTLFDSMIKTETNYDSQMEYPCTIEDQLKEMEIMIGVKINRSDLSSNSLSKEVDFWDNTISIRAYLKWIAELEGKFPYSLPDSSIGFRGISPEPNWETEDISDYEVDEIFKISKVRFDNGILIAEAGDDTGQTLYISNNNPYIDSENADDVVYKILELYQDMEFRSARKVIVAGLDDIHPMDVILYQGMKFLCTSFTSEYQGGTFQIQNFDAKLESKNMELASQKYDPLVRIKKIEVNLNQNNQSLEIISKNVEGQNEKISKLELNNEEIKTSVSELEEKVNNVSEPYSVSIFTTGDKLTREITAITMEAQVYQGGKDVTSEMKDIQFSWQRSTNDEEADKKWNESHQGVKQIEITNDDVPSAASFRLIAILVTGTFETPFRTVIDESDIINLNLELDANKPLTQTYDPNTGEFYPNWNPLTITPVPKDNVLPIPLTDGALQIGWKRYQDGVESELEANETVYQGVLTVDVNKLSEEAKRSITYRCNVTYKNQVVVQTITFSLVSDGTNGTDGKDGEKGDPGTPGKDGTTYYTWIKYADDELGNGMSDDPTDKAYIGLAHNQKAVEESNDPKDYKWSLIKGKDVAIRSDTPPSDTTLMWLDTSSEPNILKHYNGTEWVETNDPSHQIQDAVSKVTEEYQTAIAENSKDITLSVQQLREESSKAMQLLNQIESKLQLSNEALEYVRTSLSQVNNILDGKANITEIREWARFDGSVLELGRSDSPFKTRLSNTELGFWQNETKIAWVSNNELHTLKVLVEESLQIGDWLLNDEKHDGFTIRKAV